MMTNRAPTCVSCGVRAGAASTFRRGLCSQCQNDKARRKGTRTAIWHIFILIGALYVVARGISVPIGSVSFLILSLASFDVLLFVVTVVHEAAHALVALLFGFGLGEVSLGVGPRVAATRVGQTRLVVNLYPVGGHTMTLPWGDNIRSKMFAVTAAGPLSHIPLALWLATLNTGNEIWDIILGWAPELVMFSLLVNVVPVFANDGRSLVQLFSMSEDRLRSMSTAVDSISELTPTLDDPTTNPPNETQRDAILEHLRTPSLTPTDRALALNNLAVVDVLLGDPDLLQEADEASREAFELMPDQPELRNTRGSVLILKGDYSQGIAMMKPTMAKIPAEALGESHLDLAYAHVMLDRPFEGRDHLFAARASHARPDLYAGVLTRLGALEANVIRGFAEADEEPADTASRFRSQAGPQATITGEAIKAHIEATGHDREMMQLAQALAPEQRTQS